MVHSRPQHRRAVPAGITFGHRPGGDCMLSCCDPKARQEVSTTKKPLPHDCRIAFLMACTRSVPRLAEGCAPALHRLPTEVVRRIFDYCVRCEHTRPRPQPEATARARPQLPPMPALRSLERRVIKRAVLPTRVDDDLGSSMGGLDLNLPV